MRGSPCSEQGNVSQTEIQDNTRILSSVTHKLLVLDNVISPPIQDYKDYKLNIKKA